MSDIFGALYKFLRNAVKKVKTMKFGRFFNVFKRVRRNVPTKAAPKSRHNSLDTASHTAVSTDLPPAKRAVHWSKEFIKNHSRLDFDLTEAVRLRAEGYGYGRIARQMNNVSRETVVNRVSA